MQSPQRQALGGALRTTAGAILLMIGTVASFKCLGDIKRPMIGAGEGQHSVPANLIAWVIFGLLPLVLALRLWNRPADSGGEGDQRGLLLPKITIACAFLALALQFLIGPVRGDAAPSDTWLNLLVLLPLSVGAIVAASLAFVLAMVFTGLSRRVGRLQVITLGTAALSVLVTCP
jgi:hypothetical protein